MSTSLRNAGREPRVELAPHAAMLRRYLFVLGGGADRVDDLVQETFVIALQKELSGSDAAAVGRFLRGIARNLVLRDRRSHVARREVAIADEFWRRECAGDDGSGDDRIAALRTCLAALPPRSRRLLERCYEGEDRAAVAAEFGLAIEGVKTALRRLRAALRGCVNRRLWSSR